MLPSQSFFAFCLAEYNATYPKRHNVFSFLDLAPEMNSIRVATVPQTHFHTNIPSVCSTFSDWILVVSVIFEEILWYYFLYGPLDDFLKLFGSRNWLLFQNYDSIQNWLDLCCNNQSKQCKLCVTYVSTQGLRIILSWHAPSFYTEYLFKIAVFTNAHKVVNIDKSLELLQQ